MNMALYLCCHRCCAYSAAAICPSSKVVHTGQIPPRWGQRLDLETVGALNDKIAEGDMSHLILIQEALQEKRIAEIAAQIAERKTAKIVMIAGPSSSGKTTFSHRLSVQLEAIGLKPHPIAVDNYFVNRIDSPRDENGNYNYEILECLDVEQFNQDMQALLRGEQVELPYYNFKKGEREYKGDFLKLGKEDILVIEGIHCLNDRLSYSLPREVIEIYISALTQLNIDEHNRISYYRRTSAAPYDPGRKDKGNFLPGIPFVCGRLCEKEKRKTFFHIRKRQMLCLIQL